MLECLKVFPYLISATATISARSLNWWEARRHVPSTGGRLLPEVEAAFTVAKKTVNACGVSNQMVKSNGGS